MTNALNTAGDESGDVPLSLLDVSLVSARQIAAAASMSESAVLELVRRGEAPQPAIRQSRLTRWRASDVRAWLLAWAERGSDPAAEEALLDRARHAAATKSRRLVERDGKG